MQMTLNEWIVPLMVLAAIAAVGGYMNLRDQLRGISAQLRLLNKDIGTDREAVERREVRTTDKLQKIDASLNDLREITESR